MRRRMPSLAVRLALYAGLMLAAWAYYAYEWRSVDRFVKETDHCQLVFCDFVNHYYPQARNIFDATQPEDGFVYSATFAWILVPIGTLNPNIALNVWGVIQVMLTLLMIVPLSWLFLRGPERFWWRLAYCALCLTSIPLLHNFKWGQVSVLLTLCVIAAAFLPTGRSTSVLAGFLTAFAAAIKFYPALFFLIFLSTKQWRAFATAVVSVVILLALPLWPMGYARSRSFWTGNKIAATLEKGVIEDPNAQYVVRVMSADFPSTFPMQTSVRLFENAGRAVAVLNVLLAFVLGLLSIPDDSKRRLMVSLLFLTLPFVLTTSWMHYLVYLPFCQICLAYETARIGRRNNRWSTAAVFVLVGASAVLSSIPVERARANWLAYVTPGLGFHSNLAALLAAYVVIPMVIRAEPVGT